MQHGKCLVLFFIYYWWGGTKSLGTAATSGLLYKPHMIDEGDCRAIGGMNIDRGNKCLVSFGGQSYEIYA
jgi:hypothetical protein